MASLSSKRIPNDFNGARRRILLRTAASLAIPALGSSWLTACGGGDDPAPIPDTPRLASVDNFRDVAGNSDAAVYKTSGGQVLRRAQIYRSNNLSKLSDADKATLEALGVATVYDLRTPDEITKAPDKLPKGVNYVKVNILDVDNIVPPSLVSAADSIAWMESLNRGFITAASERQQIALMIKNLATTAGVQLYHCSAGKDRAGWISAMLQTLLGVSSNVIMQDYLLTNTYSATSIAATYNSLKTGYGQSYADAYMPLLGVQESFLKASFDQITLSFGTMEAYITDGLKIDSATRTALRNKMLR